MQIKCCVGIVVVAFLFCAQAQASPVRMIPNLDSITFWERTEGSEPSAYTFSIDSPQLKVRLADPLGISNSDFEGVISHEFYDVFYSDANGGVNIDGEYVTIEGTFDIGSPFGGGLNLAEIGFNLSGTSTTEYGNYVASFIALGDNAIASDVDLAVDGDLQTHTTMGNTIGQSGRLRVTLGSEFSSGPAPVPEPTSLLLLGTGLGVIGLAAWRRRK